MILRDQELAQTINRLLNEDRDACGLTNEAHAAHLGISEPTYYRIRKGRVHKTAAVLIAILLRRVPAAASLAA